MPEFAWPSGWTSRTLPAVRKSLLTWFDKHHRDLPWRACRDPYRIWVSEVMLQQTPVARVLGPWLQWMERWPVPEALAAEPSSAAVAAWGRLGYPRRALRLQEAARAVVEVHDGEVPSDEASLMALPGVGRYTAAAVRAWVATASGGSSAPTSSTAGTSGPSPPNRTAPSPDTPTRWTTGGSSAPSVTCQPSRDSTKAVTWATTCAGPVTVTGRAVPGATLGRCVGGVPSSSPPGRRVTGRLADRLRGAR